MYLLWLVFLLITGSCLSGLFGRYLGSFGASIITTSCLFLSLVGCFVYIKLAPWINSEVLNVDWGFMFDSLTVAMWVSPKKNRIYDFLSQKILTPNHKHKTYIINFLILHSLFNVMLLVYSLEIFLTMTQIFTVGAIVSNRVTLRYVCLVNLLFLSIWILLFFVYLSMLVNDPTVPIYSGDSFTVNYNGAFAVTFIYSHRCPSVLRTLFKQTIWFLYGLEPVIGFYPIIYFF